MEVVPASVGRIARSWDEQHLDLQAAATQVAGAGVAGYTTVVAGAAQRFLVAWDRHLAGLGERCEGHADGLRATIATYLDSEHATAADVVALSHLLTEER